VTIDHQRRQQILNKFPAISNARVLDPQASTQVQAVLRAEKIIAKVWGDGARVSDVLFDPARVPAMAQRADAAARDFHRRASELHYDTADAEYDRHDTAGQGVVKIWQVGSNHVHVVRDRWRESPNRKPTTTEYAAAGLGLERSLYEHWKCDEYGDDHEKACDLHCKVALAKACGGTTRLLPVDRGTLIILWRCCRNCEELAGKIAENTYKTNVKIAELEVREDWPPDNGG
jgi:hypothetical protein